MRRFYMLNAIILRVLIHCLMRVAGVRLFSSSPSGCVQIQSCPRRPTLCLPRLLQVLATSRRSDPHHCVPRPLAEAWIESACCRARAQDVLLVLWFFPPGPGLAQDSASASSPAAVLGVRPRRASLVLSHDRRRIAEHIRQGTPPSLQAAIASLELRIRYLIGRTEANATG